MNKGMLSGMKTLPWWPSWMGGGDPANDGKVLVADSKQPGAARLAPVPVYDAVCPQATGVAAIDTPNLQAFLNTLASKYGSTGYVPSPPPMSPPAVAGDPQSVYYATNADLVLDTAINVTIHWGAGAAIAPGPGVTNALKVTNGDRCHFIGGPCFALTAGCAVTRFLWLRYQTATDFVGRVQVWAYANVPTGITCVDIDEGCYFCNFQAIHTNKDSSSRTGHYAVCVRIGDTGTSSPAAGSNAHNLDKVTPGECNIGVLLDGSSGCRILSGNPENCTTYIKITENTHYPNDSHMLALPRLDSGVTYIIDCQQVTQPINGPHMLFGACYGLGANNLAVLNNPNKINFKFAAYGGLRVFEDNSVSGGAHVLENQDSSWFLADQGGNMALQVGGGAGIILNTDNATGTSTGDIVFQTGSTEAGRFVHSPATKAGGFRITGAAAIYSGSGAPTNANGNNGDWYIRTGTPGVANQRLYIRIAGTWTGVI